MKIKKPCRYQGCPGLTYKMYCDAHADKQVEYEQAQLDRKAKYLKKLDENRQSASRRGYDSKWQKFREGYLRRNPLCVDCMRHGISRPTQEIHHIKRLSTHKDLKYESSNLVPLCKSCHVKRTERGE